MGTLSVGQPAPGFRLPSAQGPEIALEDFRGRSRLVVWFTKGMVCVFCRQHMSQLARAYGAIRQCEAEVLQVTPTPLERARMYAASYRLPFPYLCDSGDVARRSWGLGVRRRGPAWYVGAMVSGMRATAPDNDFGKELPLLREMPLLLRDEDMGLFIVDRGGVVRYAYGGSYAVPGDAATPIRPIPPNDEVLRELERCA